MLFARKKIEQDPDELVQEHWKANFGLLGKKRFIPEENEAYRSVQEKGRFSLCLKRENLFAWALNPYFKYDDFLLEAEMEFEPGSPYAAMGFIFRYLNDENFYYFLLSNKGYFRFDLVFNGTPMPFINWTYSPVINKQKNNLMILAHGSRFSFFIDDEWVGEMDDNSLLDGKIGFAAQNFDQAAPLVVHLDQFSVDSRPLEVEKAVIRWNEVVPIDPEYRILLAKTFFAMGNFTTAAVQMKKVFKQKKPSVDDYLFFSENLLNLGVYDVALGYIEKALVIEPRRAEALQEKANLLYLQNRFLDARDYLKEILPGFEESAALWNLLGNSEYALGNWQASAVAYSKAHDLDSGNPLFLMNQARALELDGQKENALEKYLQVSHTLFNQEAYDDLFNILPRVLVLDPENKQVQAFRAKMLYHENKIQEASEIINKLIAENYTESAVFYLAGLLKADEGDRPGAVTLLEKACELEPTFYLNWYKLAENRFFADIEPGDALAKAVELQPEYPWTINLSGLVNLKTGKYAEAVENFRKASELAPSELDILLNFSEALSLGGNREESFQVLEKVDFSTNHRLMNHKGNLFTRYKEYEEGLREYEKALRLDPENPDYMENLAGVCIELDMIMRAEELLLKLYDTHPTATVLSLVGKLADIKHEYKRAEVAYSEALKLKPGDLTLQCHLAAVYLSKQDYRHTKELLIKLAAQHPESEEVKTIQMRMRRLFEESHVCGGCGREWWVPKEIPLQTQLKLVGEPPAEAPAGQCPSCAKVYCIGCRHGDLKEDRFTCPDCGEFLKLSADWLKYLLRETIEKEPV